MPALHERNAQQARGFAECARHHPAGKPRGFDLAWRCQKSRWRCAPSECWNASRSPARIQMRSQRTPGPRQASDSFGGAKQRKTPARKCDAGVQGSERAPPSWFYREKARAPAGESDSDESFLAAHDENRRAGIEQPPSDEHSVCGVFIVRLRLNRYKVFGELLNLLLCRPSDIDVHRLH
jgi:hypothetical protein